jgi:hypothetical protein
MFSLWLSTSFDRTRLTHLLATRKQPSFEVSFNDSLYYHLIHYLSYNKWKHFRFQHKSIHVCPCLYQEVLTKDLTIVVTYSQFDSNICVFYVFLGFFRNTLKYFIQRPIFKPLYFYNDFFKILENTSF